MHAPLFLAPLRLEAWALRRGAPHAKIERIGMGPVRAVAACQSLASRATNDQPIVLAGVAGALTDDLDVGDIVVASSVSPLGESETFSFEGTDELAEHLAGPDWTVRVAPIVSSASIVKGEKDRSDAALGGALAVDMESLWCAPLGRSAPFYVVRVILDVPGRDVISWSTPRSARKAFRSLAHVARTLTGQPSVPVRPSHYSQVGED